MVMVSASMASYIALPFISLAALRCYSRSAGQADQGQEEVVDLADRVDEVLEVDRLADERVGVQRVAADDVLLGARGGQHDHRDDEQVGILLQLGEHLQAAAAGPGSGRDDPAQT